MSHKELIAISQDAKQDSLIAAYNEHSLGYAETSGSNDLRTDIASLYGEDITANQVVVFPGAQTAMTLCAQSIIDEGDHAIVITPSYQSLEEGIKLAGGEVTRIMLSPNDNWQLNISAVEQAIKNNTKYLVLNDPHNPTGSLMTLSTKQRLISLIEENDLIILSDEVYRFMEYDQQESSPSMADLSVNAISLSTMSKSWGLGGTGIGWIVCQNQLICDMLRRAQHLYATCFSRAGEHQAMMAIRSSDQIISKNMAIIKDNLKLLDNYFIKNSDLFHWVRPKAGGTGFVMFKGPLTGNELARQLLDNGILVFPPYIFDCDDNLKQYFRIGFTRKTMPAALDAFALFINQQRSFWSK
jgi:aspartate/methionine/tyrosine aminotransferase